MRGCVECGYVFEDTKTGEQVGPWSSLKADSLAVTAMPRTWWKSLGRWAATDPAVKPGSGVWPWSKGLHTSKSVGLGWSQKGRGEEGVLETGQARLLEPGILKGEQADARTWLVRSSPCHVWCSCVHKSAALPPPLSGIQLPRAPFSDTSKQVWQI